MYVKPHFQFTATLRWSRRILLGVAAWASVLVACHHLLGWEWLQIPALPVTVLGTAVSFYLGFKGNAAYERLWEARKIWGGIVNTSRTWGTFVTSMVTDQRSSGDSDVALAEVHRELVYRHIAWLNALYTQLRRATSWEHREVWNDDARKRWNTLDNTDDMLSQRVAPFVATDELAWLMQRKNRATQLVHTQGKRLTELFAESRIDDFRHMKLAAILEELYTLQGKCERIKNFPLPRQYATVNRWFVWVFVAILPLALLHAFQVASLPEWYVWGVVPASTLVGWVFWTWDLVLEYSENPFEGLINDIPMEALSRTIEIDLRDMLGETDLPPGAAPYNGEVLM